MNTNESPTENKPATISGRKAVGAMFVMGIIGGTLCVTYAIWHNAPYFELKKALAAEFPKSVPQVEGGTHKGSPMTLRIVLNVNFHPGEEENSAQVDAAVERILALAREHQDLRPYEVLRIHLVKKRPQDLTSRKTVEIKLDAPAAKPAASM